MEIFIKFNRAQRNSESGTAIKEKFPRTLSLGVISIDSPVSMQNSECPIYNYDQIKPFTDIESTISIMVFK